MSTVPSAAVTVALLFVALAAQACGADRARKSAPANPLALAVYGDAPYGTKPGDTAQFDATPAFIDSINADHQVKLVLHVGDIHSGKQLCTRAYDRSVFRLWTRFRDPLVYTPGDNEWSDCHKRAEGGNVDDSHGHPVAYADGNPVANLALIRSIFFPHAGETLAHRRHVTSQASAHASAHPRDARYVENVTWEQEKIVFVTVNVPGGSNNDADPWYGAPVTAEQRTERTRRTAADMRWLDAAFARARRHHDAGVVVAEQADMWDTNDAPDHQTDYESLVGNIARNTRAFGRPVLLLNGDSHVYRSDNPLVRGAPCVAEPSSGAAAVACTDDAWRQHPVYDVPNFHRVVVHGSTFPLEWLRLGIDPHAAHPTTDTSFGPFSWERMTQAR